MIKDIRLLFTTRIIRMFGYGFLSVVLALYLAQRGLGEGDIGLLFTLTLAGDAGITLWLTTSADRMGRRKTLIIGALLMVMAGLVFSLTGNFIFLVVTAIIGVISPSGNEIGPFLSIEQASLSQLVPDASRTQTFAWYNLAGSFATASGALLGGALAQVLQNAGYTALDSYRAVVLGYTVIGLIARLPVPLPIQISGSTCDGRSHPAAATVRAAPLTPGGVQAFQPVRPGRLRRRAGGAVHGGVLVQCEVRCPAGGAGDYFLRREYPGRYLCAIRSLDRQAHWSDQYHGIHPYSVQYPADHGAASCPHYPWRSSRFYSGSAFRRWMCPRANRTPWRWSARMNVRLPWV